MATEAIEFQGSELQRGNGATPEVFTTIAEVKDVNGPGGSATVIDASHAQSTRKEKLMGLPDEGQLTFTCNYIPGNAVQAGLRADRAARTPRNFRLLINDDDNTVHTFTAFVLGYTNSGAVDGLYSNSVTLEITDEYDWGDA